MKKLIIFFVQLFKYFAIANIPIILNHGFKQAFLVFASTSFQERNFKMESNIFNQYFSLYGSLSWQLTNHQSFFLSIVKPQSFLWYGVILVMKFYKISMHSKLKYPRHSYKQAAFFVLRKMTFLLVTKKTHVITVAYWNLASYISFVSY